MENALEASMLLMSPLALVTVTVPSESSVLVSPVSASVSLASTSKDFTSFSPAVPVSATATGPSLAPVTVRVRVEDEGAPWLSFMV